MIMLRLSIIRMNKTGDRGQPYRIPLEAGKKYEGVPLIKTTKQEFLKHPIIQLTPNRGIHIYRSKSLRKVQLTLSKALTKSSFSTRTLEVLDLMECKNSWVMPTGLVI